MTYYDVDDIASTIRNEIAQYEALIAAWQAVTFPKKKDGKPFKSMAKNIQGATYQRNKYALGAGENELIVHSKVGAHYISDQIDCHILVKYLKPDDPRKAKTQNLLPKEPMLNQIYLYDLDDIKTAIGERVEHFAEQTAALKTNLENVQMAYDQFESDYKKALAQLKVNLGTTDQSFVHSAIKETVIRRTH